jgi:probable rRNA maturation factor
MHHITIQQATDEALVPKKALLRKWAKTALSVNNKPVEVTLRIVGMEEMTELNSTYRHKQGPTNVLSFPFEAPQDINMETIILGDIIICADVVNHEAEVQRKLPEAHWAHMVVHGIFHLLGYDHETDKDAEVMEALEIKIMRSLGFSNPYEAGDDIKHYD